MKIASTIKAFTPLVGIILIAGLEYKALCLGINGVLLSGSLAAIAGISGFEIKAKLDQRKRVEESKDHANYVK